MPVSFYNSNEGLGDLARALVSAPAVYGQAREKGRAMAQTRMEDAAGIQKSIADARKTMFETQQIRDQQDARAELPESIGTINAYQTGSQRRVDPPQVGSAGSPLEADVNASIRGNQGLFASTDVPGQDDLSNALANIVRAYGGNAEQVMGATMQGSLGSEAARGAQNTFDGGELVAALQAIGTGQQLPQMYDLNSQGIQSQRYSPGIDESGQLAQANIGAERALQQDRAAPDWQRVDMNTGQGVQSGFVDMNAPAPESTFRPLGQAEATEPGKLIQDPETGEWVPNPAWMEMEKAGAPQVNVGAEDMQTEQGKKLGQYLGDTFIEIQEQAREAAQQNQQLDRIEQLLEGVHTGRGMPTLTQIQGLASTFGVELGSDLGQKEAAESLTNQIALRFRSPESGMGLPGATSDRDIAFLKSFPPGIQQSPEGRQLITETFRRINQRKQEVAQTALDLVRQNQQQGINGLTWDDVGTIQQTWAQPMFDDELIRRAESLQGQTTPQGSQFDQGGGESPPSREQAAQPQTQAEYDALEPGALYIDPADNKLYRKPADAGTEQ